MGLFGKSNKVKIGSMEECKAELSRIGQPPYMDKIRKCGNRVNNKCGNMIECERCGHYQMVKAMLEEEKILPDDREFHRFYTIVTSRRDIKAWIEKFEVI